DRTDELRKEIEERELVQIKLVDAKLAAEQASRAKSDFLANMSHEIRTPMNGVLGMTELALETELNAEQFEYLTMARTSARSLLAVINDILDFSKIEAGKLDLDPVDFPLHQDLFDCIKPLAYRAQEKGIEMILDIDLSAPGMLRGDPLR